MVNEILATKDRWLAAVFSEDRQALVDLMDPEFVLHQAAGLAYAGTYRGPDGFFSWWEKFNAAYDIDSLENIDTFLSTTRDAVVLEFRFRGRVKATGEAFDSTILEIFQFRDGKMLRIAPHWFEIP